MTYKSKPKSPLAALGVGSEADALTAALSRALAATAGSASATKALGQLARTIGGAAGASSGPPPMLRQPDEPDVLAARPSDGAEPMLLWTEDPRSPSHESSHESWHL